MQGYIGHTQPRRVAARAVAERVAERLGLDIGGSVGYAVRFTDRVGEQSLVKVMTDVFCSPKPSVTGGSSATRRSSLTRRNDAA